MDSNPDNAEQGARGRAGGDNGHPDLRGALDALHKAVAEGHVEPICAGYLAVHHAAAGMTVGELVQAVRDDVGDTGFDKVVSAFSHRRCFMCTGGCVPCDQCDGTGAMRSGKPCESCGATGLMPCGFCTGTGWADRETIPGELARVVFERQLLHVRSGMNRVGERIGQLTPEGISALGPERRDETLRWLIRLQSRLRLLLRSPAITDANEHERMESVSQRIDASLDLSQAAR